MSDTDPELDAGDEVEVVDASEGPERDEGTELYREAAELLLAPASPASVRSAWVWLLITLGLFALSFSPGNGWWGLLCLVGVLLLHESGHFAGMWAFGYRDL